MAAFKHQLARTLQFQILWFRLALYVQSQKLITRQSRIRILRTKPLKKSSCLRSYPEPLGETVRQAIHLLYQLLLVLALPRRNTSKQFIEDDPH
jgi:hypothetical protein